MGHSHVLCRQNTDLPRFRTIVAPLKQSVLRPQAELGDAGPVDPFAVTNRASRP
jgi:hypothetical protein